MVVLPLTQLWEMHLRSSHSDDSNKNSVVKCDNIKNAMSPCHTVHISQVAWQRDTDTRLAIIPFTEHCVRDKLRYKGTRHGGLRRMDAILAEGSFVVTMSS